MTTSALEAVYGAIYNALTSDLQLNTLLGGRVYDLRAPDGAVFPYITIGDASELGNDTFGGNGTDAPQTLHLWTQAPQGERANRQRVFVLWGHVLRLLTGGLTMTGRALVFSDVSLLSASEDPDDPEHRIMHGVVRFRAITEVP